MTNGPSFDALIDALAERLAAKILPKIEEALAAGNHKPRLLSISDAAGYLSRTEHSVRHLIASGKLPVTRIPGTRRIFLDIHDLDQVIDASKEVAV